ncbi:hypothetical protein CI238_12598 [Colletotrichum incanum]|uniref:Uncharacterized protein n=1 Tax=Colletotrichum incanum TaxID=1573173 RepID=A0A161X2N5_COLIC|nr:hypothetical protein CI238_12598 [Colletotrichum incanum]OHW98417.1 hypothetical protein CSPAE12_02836 [Colletotrichum incanum]
MLMVLQQHHQCAAADGIPVPPRPTRDGASTGFGTSANSPSNARHDGRPVSLTGPSILLDAKPRHRKKEERTLLKALRAMLSMHLRSMHLHSMDTWRLAYMQHVQLFTGYPPLSNRPTAAFLGICIRLLEQLIRNDLVLSAFVLGQSPTAPLAPLTSPVAPTGQSVKSAHPQLHTHSVPPLFCRPAPTDTVPTLLATPAPESRL